MEKILIAFLLLGTMSTFAQETDQKLKESDAIYTCDVEVLLRSWRENDSRVIKSFEKVLIYSDGQNSAGEKLFYGFAKLDETDSTSPTIVIRLRKYGDHYENEKLRLWREGQTGLGVYYVHDGSSITNIDNSNQTMIEFYNRDDVWDFSLTFSNESPYVRSSSGYSNSKSDFHRLRCTNIEIEKRAKDKLESTTKAYIDADLLYQPSDSAKSKSY